MRIGSSHSQKATLVTIKQNPKCWAVPFCFDPSTAFVVREPVGAGEGYWAGAPSVMYDGEGEKFYLVYRIRRPRGVLPDRGAEIRIAVSDEGLEFEDIWTGYKDELGSTSIERCALEKLDDGRWGLYVSYVDPADGRWRIDLVEADKPDQFDFATASKLFTAADINAEGIKDPFLFRVGGLRQMIVSYATADVSSSADEMHGTHDAYNTGLIKSRTGLAVSEDGRNWRWEGEILGPSDDGWDCYCSRIGCVWRQDGIWLAFYDGSASVAENYEERLGVAFSHDLRTFQRVTSKAPWIEQPHGRGALRYFDVLQLPDRTLIYFETSQADGSHDLRVVDQRP